ncbi:MAG TPA: AAA family ATPase [Gaiella sp.]|nr:AAA family ATPase [Gaiella sp.]
MGRRISLRRPGGRRARRARPRHADHAPRRRQRQREVHARGGDSQGDGLRGGGWRARAAGRAAGRAAARLRRRVDAGSLVDEAAEGILPPRRELLQHRGLRRRRLDFRADRSLYGEVPLHEQSHGQSFLSLAANRFGGDGLYVLDEPEAALSVSGALALLAIAVRAARAGAQLVIATHSPILLACPGARIYELDDHGIAPCAYDDLETVRLTRAFLDAPDRFIHAALGDVD